MPGEEIDAGQEQHDEAAHAKRNETTQHFVESSLPGRCGLVFTAMVRDGFEPKLIGVTAIGGIS